MAEHLWRRGKENDWADWPSAKTRISLRRVDEKGGLEAVCRFRTIISEVNSLLSAAWQRATGQPLTKQKMSNLRDVGKFLTQLAAHCGAGAIAFPGSATDSDGITASYDFWRTTRQEFRRDLLAALQRGPQLGHGVRAIMESCGGDRAVGICYETFRCGPQQTSLFRHINREREVWRTGGIYFLYPSVKYAN